MTFPELLSDPVRARIYLEVLLNEEVTAQQLMDTIKVSRSTMSHHLSRFVEDRVLNVRVQEKGRSVKFYSRNPELNKEIVLKCLEDTKITERIMFLESASAHLQVISSLLTERARRIREKPIKPKQSIKVAFTFSLMSKEEANIWNEEYEAFQKRFEERRKTMKIPTKSIDYVGYGGITPTIRYPFPD